jgi:hypothetical protein
MQNIYFLYFYKKMNFFTYKGRINIIKIVEILIKLMLFLCLDVYLFIF